MKDIQFGQSVAKAIEDLLRNDKLVSHTYDQKLTLMKQNDPRIVFEFEFGCDDTGVNETIGTPNYIHIHVPTVKLLQIIKIKYPAIPAARKKKKV